MQPVLSYNTYITDRQTTDRWTQHCRISATISTVGSKLVSRIQKPDFKKVYQSFNHLQQ